jgi:hypothetical protein
MSTSLLCSLVCAPEGNGVMGELLIILVALAAMALGAWLEAHGR